MWQTDRRTDRKRCIWAYHAICTGGLKNWRPISRKKIKRHSRKKKGRPSSMGNKIWETSPEGEKVSRGLSEVKGVPGKKIISKMSSAIPPRSLIVVPLLQNVASSLTQGSKKQIIRLSGIRPKKINDGFPLTGPKFKGSVGREFFFFFFLIFFLLSIPYYTCN